MKILWIADFGLQHTIGGAQRTDSFVIAEGKERGHEIEFFYHDTPSDQLKECDLVVSGNMENLHKRPDVFEFIVNHSNHVRYEHDANAYLNNTARKQLFGSSKHNFFLSEYHHKKFVELYGDIFPNVDIIPSPLDTSKFFDRNEVREEKTLYIGFFHALKGTHNFFQKALFNPQEQFVVAGWGKFNLVKTVRTLPNVEYLGKVDYDDMPNLYNKYKRFYFHPYGFEPFCRSVGEALLCGIKPDCSDNIGAIHTFNEIGLDGLKKVCTESPKKFWEIAE